MKNIVALVLIIVISACSKNENKSQDFIKESPSMTIELSPVTLSVDPSESFPSSSLDFSSISYKDKVIQNLIIKNNSQTDILSFAGEDFNLTQIYPFNIQSNSCLGVTLSPRQSCVVKLSISNLDSLLTDQNISSTLTIKGSDISLSAILQLDPTDYNAPIVDISVSPLSLNFGDVKGGSTKDLNVIVKNLSGESKNISLSSINSSHVTVVSNTCSILSSRRSCSIKLRYLASVDELVVNQNLIQIANYQITYSVNSYIPTINNPEIIPYIDPLELSSVINLTQPESHNGTISFINNGITTFLGLVSGNSSHSSISITSVDCASGLIRGKTCNLTYSVDSSIAPTGNSSQYIWIQSGTSASKKHLLDLNIVPISCTIANANIANAASVSGNIIDGCIVETCESNYTKEENQCKFLANISIVSGNNQSQVYSSLLTAPFVAEVKTPAGSPMIGIPITWSVIENNGLLSNIVVLTDSQGRVSANYTLGSNPGSNTVRVQVDTLSVFEDFNSTGNLSPFNYSWGFDTGTSLDYDLTGSIEFSNGKVSLKNIDQLDDSNSTLGFGSSTMKGVAWDEALSHIRLSSDSTCNGTLTNCSELENDWTPKKSNLIGHWKFNNNLTASVGEDGITSGTPSFSPNLRMGSHSLLTTGGNQAINVGDIPELNNTTKFTISGWFLQNTLDVRGGLFAKIKDASNMIRARTWEDGYLYSYVYNGSTSLSYFDYSAFISAGKWFHYTLVFDGTLSGNAARFKVYIDGNEVPQSFSGIIPSSVPNLSGADFEIAENSLHFGSPTASINGHTDEFAIWNEALTPLEIKRIYDIQKIRYSGNLVSRSIDSENILGNWTDFSWRTNLPYFKGLPDYISGTQSETSSEYPSISNNLMSGNIGLYHLDEVAGTTGANSVIDRSSAAKHGTPVSTIFGEEGKIFRSARSNGGYINLGSNSNLRHSSLFSVSFWAKGSGNFMGAGAAGGQGYGGFVVGADASLSFTWTPSNPGSDRSFTCTQKGVAGEWNHFAMVINFSGNTATCFINGIQSGGTTNLAVVTWTPVITYNSGYADSIGGRYVNSWSPFVGSYDEVAIWNRSLTLTEARQIYRRGANRIKYQVRSCSNEDCSDALWLGPDNTSNTYFSEIYNITGQAVNPTGIIGITHPKMYFSNFSNLVSNKQYFQYKVILESEDQNSLCSYGNCSPELTSVQVAPITRYSAMNPTVVNNIPVNFYSLSSFSQTLGASCPSGVSYNLSLDKNTWFYFNGSNWEVSDNSVSQSNDAATINSNLTTIPDQIGTGSFYFRAMLKSDGSSTCELDQVQISGGQ